MAYQKLYTCNYSLAENRTFGNNEFGLDAYQIESTLPAFIMAIDVLIDLKRI